MIARRERDLERDRAEIESVQENIADATHRLLDAAEALAAKA